MTDKEKTFYPHILEWLNEYLCNKYPKLSVTTHDVHSVYLSDFMQGENNFQKHFPAYSTYKIKIDLLGTIAQKEKLQLAIVEVKIKPLNLRDVSQLLGYCKILKPEFAFLISPSGIGTNLNKFLTHYKRQDILEFEKNKFMRVAKWNQDRKAIENGSVIPPFGHHN